MTNKIDTKLQGKLTKNNIRNLGIYHHSTQKSQNWDFYRMSLKFTGEICVMTIRTNAKFEQELTCQFKIDTRNLTNFDPSTQKLKKLHFNKLLLIKV